MNSFLDKFNSIKSKLIILLLLIALVPLGIFSYFQIQSMRSTIKEDFVKASQKEMKQIDNAFSIYFSQVEKNCDFLATDPLVKQADDTITTYMNKTNRNQLKLTPLKNGGIEAEIYKKYKHFAETHDNAAYVYFAAKNGGYIQWPANNVMKNYDPRERPFYKQAMQNQGQITKTAPYYFKADDAVIISTVTTVENNSGETIGVQGLDVSLKGLTKMIENIQVGNNGYVILATEKGKILAHPKRPEFNFKNINKLNVEELKNIKNIKNDHFSTTLDEENYFMNLYTAPKTGWKFISVIPQNELTARINQMYFKILTIALVIAVLVIFIAIYVSNKISTSIVKATNFAEEIADNNLSVEELAIESNDELGSLGTALNKMKSNLQDVISHLLDTVEELSAYSEQLSAAAEEGTATIKTTNQKIENMSAGIEEISAGAQEVTSYAQESSSQTEVGQENIEETLANVREINHAVEQAVTVINNLDEKAEKIDEIVSLIINIAEQTNLLALNAAIEAARAGEAGQGFAVVAEEIRDLAEETNQATEKITGLINETQENTKVALDSIREVEEKAKLSRESAEETGEVFEQINTAADETAQQIEQTASATQDLAKNSDELMTASQEIDNLSEEIATSSQQLAEMAQELETMIEKFKL